MDRIVRMELSRREFIRKMVALGFSVATAGTLFSLLACSSEEISVPPPTTTPTPDTTPDPTPTNSYLAVARGESPTVMVQAALMALGGIEQFVKAGDDVIIKPNLVAADYSYEYAAFTNPEVVGAVTALCVGAGANVRVMDLPNSGTSEQVYARSGISDAVTGAGGQVEVMSSFKYRDTTIPDGKDITSWNVYGDVLDADVLINVPIAKHHNLAVLTLGMKNIALGVITDRNQMHINLGQRIADLNTLIRPTLTVVDAVRILMNNGPRGGSLNDVKLTNTIIASQDIVAADAYAATLFGLTGSDVPAIRAGAEMGLGTMDLSNVYIEEISV